METPEPAITVVIVNFNSGDRLSRVMDALNQQTFTDFNVLIIDNSSVDGSASQSFAISPVVRWQVNAENLGFAGGIMTGTRRATAPWLALLNPDAYPDPDWLAALNRAAERYGPKAVFGSVQLTADNPDILDGLGDVYHASGVAWRGGFGKPASSAPTEDRETFAACFAAALVHRETFLEEGGLDERFFCYHEDVDFGFRHRLLGGRAILVHDAVVRHEGSGISGRYSAFTVYHGIRNRVWTLFKNVPGALLVPVVPLFLVFSAAFLLRSFMLGIGRPYTKGWLAGVRGLPSLRRSRQDTLKQRRVSLAEIARAINWSPTAPFRRAPDLRPISPPRREP